MSIHGTESKPCFWCALPKATKGITVGIVGSLLVHATILSAVAYWAGGASGGDGRQITQSTRTIDVGTFVIKTRKPSANAINAKEI